MEEVSRVGERNTAEFRDTTNPGLGVGKGNRSESPCPKGVSLEIKHRRERERGAETCRSVRTWYLGKLLGFEHVEQKLS